MESIDKQIVSHIKKAKKGSLFFPEDFIHYGNSGAIRIALHRLVEKKEIKRITTGIYTKAVENKLIGETLPSTEEIALAIAKRDKARIIPTGIYALNVLGLSTQIPLKMVYLTDGTSRTINLGNRTILLKKTTPKNLSTKGVISGLVIQALKQIGKDKVSNTEKERVIEILQNENVIKLKHDITLAPEWIREIMKQALLKNTNQ